MEDLAPEEAQLLIRWLRLLRGWSPAELAAAAGVAPDAVVGLEEGTGAPARELIETLVEAVGLPELWVNGALLPVLRKARDLSSGRRDAPSESAETYAARLGAEIGETARAAMLDFLAETESLWEAEEGTALPDDQRRRRAIHSSTYSADFDLFDEQTKFAERLADLWEWALSEFIQAKNAERGEVTPAAPEAAAPPPAPGDPGEAEQLRTYIVSLATTAQVASQTLRRVADVLGQATDLWTGGETTVSSLKSQQLLQLDEALRAGQARFQEAFDLLATAVPPAETQAGKKRGIN